MLEIDGSDGGSVSAEKTVHIKTYGCQMNVYDSERMSDTLTALGYTETDSPETADLVILNTCHIREKAAEKVYSELGKLRKMEEVTGRDVTIAVAGCVAQAEGEEIIRRAPVVDLVFGPQTYHRLPELLQRVAKGERPAAGVAAKVPQGRSPARSRPNFPPRTSSTTCRRSRPTA